MADQRRSATVQLKLVDLVGLPLRTPEVTFTIQRDGTPRVWEEAVRVLDDARPVSFALQPSHMTYSGKVRPRFYNSRQLEPFTLLARGDTESQTLAFRRDLRQWTASFVSWTGLDHNFKAFRTVWKNSAGLAVVGKETTKKWGLEGLTKQHYDGIDGGGERYEVLAKAALLNICYKMRRMIDPVGRGGEKPWFNYVLNLVEIRQDRIIAEVRRGMRTSIQQVRDQIQNFSEYVAAGPSDHWNNMPQHPYSLDEDSLISIKTNEDRANLQLTVASGTKNGKPVTVLDADMDIFGPGPRHDLEAVLNWLRGRKTNPFVIRELLDDVKDDELGYVLKGRDESRGKE